MSFLQSRTRAAREGFGKPVLRKDDARLLVGGGCYSDDVNLPGQACACFVRAPHAHARVGRIDTTAALATPGVLAALTGKDARADGVGPLKHSPMPGNPYEDMVRAADVAFVAPHPPVPADRARFAGEIVAMVIAETPAAARDGAERVVVEWIPLLSVTASLAAADHGAPLVWDETGSNVCVDSEVGDAAAVDTAFSRAAHVVRLETWVHRITGVPMEPRAAVGAWDPTSGRYTVHAGAGGLGRTQTGVAGALGVPESAVRVTARDVGGNFGTRNSCYPEFALVAWAARRLGRPVKWTAERREAFLADYHGRDLTARAELALDTDGTFLAFRGANTSNVGAHAVSFHPLNKGMALTATVYRMPAAAMRGRAVITNTSPTTPYRSAGRPEVMFIMERLIDLAARRHGFDRLELRRKNLVRAAAMPHRNSMGVVYDSGDYQAALGPAVAHGDGPGGGGAPAPGGRARQRVRGAAVPGEGQRPLGRRVRGRARRDPRRLERRDDAAAVVSLRQRGVRGRGGSRDRRGGARALHHCRRLRPGRQPDDPARPDARRHRAGRGSGAAGSVRVRPREWPAALGDDDGLRVAARRHAARVHHRDQRGAVDVPSARPARRRRGRDHARAGRRGERHRRRAGRAGRGTYRDARDLRACLGADSRRPGLCEV